MKIDTDTGVPFHQSPGSSSVVEMNRRQENCVDLFADTPNSCSLEKGLGSDELGPGSTITTPFGVSSMQAGLSLLATEQGPSKAGRAATTIDGNFAS